MSSQSTKFQVLRSIIDNISCLKEHTRFDGRGVARISICPHAVWDTIFEIAGDKLRVIHTSQSCWMATSVFYFSLNSPSLVKSVDKAMRKLLVRHNKACVYK